LCGSAEYVFGVVVEKLLVGNGAGDTVVDDREVGLLGMDAIVRGYGRMISGDVGEEGVGRCK
jgi:hypothetical protein